MLVLVKSTWQYVITHDSSVLTHATMNTIGVCTHFTWTWNQNLCCSRYIGQVILNFMYFYYDVYSDVHRSNASYKCFTSHKPAISNSVSANTSVNPNFGQTDFYLLLFSNNQNFSHFRCQYLYYRSTILSFSSIISQPEFVFLLFILLIFLLSIPDI